MSDAGMARKATGLWAVTLSLAFFVGACERGPAQNQLNEYGNPMKLAPRPTTPEITAADLRTRLYIFADDSMMGRQVGREGNEKGTDYIAHELQRLGVEPAGDDGTYFQRLPYVVRKYTDKSTLSVAGQPLTWMTDFVATPGFGETRPIDGVQVIYGGVAGDTTREITAEQAAGKLVVLSPADGTGQRGRGFRGRGRGRFGRGGRFADAAGIATADLDALSPAARAFLNNPPGRLNAPQPGRRMPPGPQATNLRISKAAAAKLLGEPLDGVAVGKMGGTISAQLDLVEEPVPDYARNVVGIIRGSDPALAGEYVALGAHNDHIGFRATPVDHDSLRAFNTARLDMEMEGGDLHSLTPEQVASIHVNVDSLHRIEPARMDSISNGADDDGSGSMALLEIAEALVNAPQKPHRSILFVFHTGEEAGLVGSRWYTDHPTVPLDSIVTQINIDMIGRGRAGDIPGGGENYLGVVGSKRLSTELGDLVASVDQQEAQPLDLDYRFDEQTTWPGYNNIYGRSDHANYARFNIPIAFFFTGLHQDYHQVTDEPEYIDYPHYAHITNYIKDLVVAVGNLDHRPVVDKPNPPSN